MQSYLRFPFFKTKAVTLSYDDAVVQDQRLISIMNKYGLKGTFNVNGGVLDWEKNKSKYRMAKDEAIEVFKDCGMEIAMHGKDHVFLDKVSGADTIKEFYEDKMILEDVFGTMMRGGAYAYGRYPDQAIEVLKMLGIKYFRTTKSTFDFNLPSDWLRLEPTCHHKAKNLFELVDKFLAEKPDSKLDAKPMLFYLWGHSYEFDMDNNWEIIEEFAKKVSSAEDVYHATNIEIYDYVKAYESLEYSLDGKKIMNRTATDVYLYYNREYVLAKAGCITEIE